MHTQPQTTVLLRGMLADYDEARCGTANSIQVLTVSALAGGPVSRRNTSSVYLGGMPTFDCEECRE